jgi:glycosyltransferase involved in cell wall biosynthesis
MEKLLIITYYWPPAGGAGVQRWLKFSKYLSKLGYELHIYTVKNPESPENDSSLLKDIPKNIKIIKKPIWEPMNFYKKFTGQKGNINASFLNENSTEVNNSFTQKISLFIRGNFFIPDAKMFWIKPSVKFLKTYITDNNINTIITTGPPHSVNVIGLKLKTKLDIFWIADFRDPWTNIDFYRELKLTKWADKIHHKLEKNVLQKADKIVVVGNTMKEEFDKISGKNNISVITNGYDADDFSEYKKQNNNKFIIAHIGSINKDRNHESFYKSLNKLIKIDKEFEQKIKIVFVGKVDASVKEMLNKYDLIKYTEIVNYLPHNEVVQYMFNANLLYLPINNTPNAKGILTGKFFEYLASKNPILAIGPTDGDIAKILKETNSGEIFDFTDTDGIFNFIKYFKNNKYIFEGIERYSREELTNDLVKLLNLQI